MALSNPALFLFTFLGGYMLAVLPAFTVLRRMVFGYGQIKRLEKNEPLLDAKAAPQGVMRLALWRYRRGTLAYDVVTAMNVAVILFVDVGQLWG